jgi:hypothetical protein
MQTKRTRTTRNRRRRTQKWLELQRERALTLMSLRALNESLEQMRPTLHNPPLDGYTIKLGGTGRTPGLSGQWLETYIDRAIAERIVSEDELVAA